MPTIDEKLRSYLTSDGIVSNTVGNDVFGAEARPNVSSTNLPLVRFFRVSQRHKNQMSGVDEWRGPVYQFDCVAKTNEAAANLAEDVIDTTTGLRAETGIEGVFVRDSRSSLRDEDTEGFQFQVDVEIHHDERISTT